MSSMHPTSEDMDIAMQAHAEVKARAVAAGRKYTRQEVATRIREITNGFAKASYWKARCLHAEAQLTLTPARP